MVSFNLRFICSLKQWRKVFLCGSLKKSINIHRKLLSQSSFSTVLSLFLSGMSHFLFIVSFSFPLWQVYLNPSFFSKHCLLTLISQVLPFSLARIQFRSISHCLSRCLWITSTDQESRALSSHQPFSSLPEGMKSARAHSQMLRYEDWELEGGGANMKLPTHSPLLAFWLNSRKIQFQGGENVFRWLCVRACPSQPADSRISCMQWYEWYDCRWIWIWLCMLVQLVRLHVLFCSRSTHPRLHSPEFFKTFWQQFLKA